MHLRSFIAGVGLVATANALLLPPDLTIADDDVITTLPVPIGIDADMAVSQVPETQSVNLDCPGCLPFGRRHRKQIPSHLKLDFSVESTDGPDRLTLNGYELYPNPDPIHNTLTAPVLPNVASRRMGTPPRFRGGLDRPRKNQVLGFAIGTGMVATDDDDDVKLINIDIQIIEVGDVFIERIPEVQVKLVKTPSGKLAIGAIETIPSEPRPTDEAEGQKQCATKVCRWKAAFFEKLSHVFSKGCGGSKTAPPLPGHGHGEFRQGHGHGHGPHPHHMGHGHSWGHGLRLFATHILFPILIGIVAGVSASIIGMMVGTLIVFLWRALFRRSYARASHRCRYAHKASKHESVVDEEKSGLLNGQDEIEAPPAYVDSHVIVAEDKKPESES